MDLRQIAEIPLRRRLHHLVAHVADGGLPLSRYRELGEELGRLSWLDLVGTAPLARPDLPEIAAAFDVDLVTVSTVANEGEPVVDGVRRLRRRVRGELTVILAIDGLDATHDALHGAGSWDRVWAAFDGLRGIPEVRVEFRTVVRRCNVDELLALAEFVHGWSPDGHVVTVPSLGDDAAAAPDVDVLDRISGPLFAILDRYVQDDGRLLSRVRRNFHRRRFDTAVRTLAEGRQVVPCLAGLSHAVLYADGRVGVCELLAPIGSVRDRSWAEVWQGGVLERQRQYIGAGGCHCTDECAMHDSLLVRPRSLPRLLVPG
ncbi:MAG: radical SAM protein [Deltaproteobacteria bacterium]|nr:MAG: radical SAM protein [Deltaproteobacteria bacterium]